MPARRKVSDSQLVLAYGETGSIYTAGKLLGIRGSSVHERLQKLKIARSNPPFSDAEKARLQRDYESFAARGRLDDLASEMRRTKSLICRQAKKLGLTNKDRPKPYLAPATGQRFRDWHRTHQHPRGMLGKTHSEQTKDFMSAGSAKRWQNMTPAQRAALVENQNVSWKQGWRTIGGIRRFYRSRWEANYARYLQWLCEQGQIAGWRHEPRTFWFEKIRRGTRSYLPDFEVIENSGISTFHEVKGWMDPRSKVKIRRMALYYPRIRLIVIGAKQYRAIASKVSGLIMGWE